MEKEQPEVHLTLTLKEALALASTAYRKNNVSTSEEEGSAWFKLGQAIGEVYNGTEEKRKEALEEQRMRRVKGETGSGHRLCPKEPPTSENLKSLENSCVAGSNPALNKGGGAPSRRKP